MKNSNRPICSDLLFRTSKKRQKGISRARTAIPRGDRAMVALQRVTIWSSKRLEAVVTCMTDDILLSPYSILVTVYCLKGEIMCSTKCGGEKNSQSGIVLKFRFCFDWFVNTFLSFSDQISLGFGHGSRRFLQIPLIRQREEN